MGQVWPTWEEEAVCALIALEQLGVRPGSRHIGSHMIRSKDQPASYLLRLKQNCSVTPSMTSVLWVDEQKIEASGTHKHVFVTCTVATVLAGWTVY